MTDEKLISVIVPVYNVEKYLDRCIASIVNQTYKKLEIILVDDGSSDSSAEICDKWSKMDKRVTVVHKDNNGSAAARNSGLDIAKGEFISFIDSDDYISNQMYSVLVEGMNSDVDVTECSYQFVYDDSYIFEIADRDFKEYTTEAALELHIKDELFSQIVWNKLYRSDVLHDVRFTEGKTIDDEFFTYLAVGRCRKLAHTDTILYAYRQQDMSIMHTLNDEKRLQSVEAKINRQEYIQIYFPKLSLINKTNLWYSCLACGQAVVSDSAKKNDIKLLFLKSALKDYGFKTDELFRLTIKQRLVFFAARVNFKMTCKTRNLLKRGY